MKRYKAEEGDRLLRTVHTTDLATLFKLANLVHDNRSYVTSVSKEVSAMSKRAEE